MDVSSPRGSRTVSGLRFPLYCNSKLTRPTSQIKLKVTLRLEVSQPVWLGVKLHFGPRPDLYYYQAVAALVICGSLSDERTALSFTTAADPRQRDESWVRFQRDS
jgi:hypothetical protein